MYFLSGATMYIHNYTVLLSKINITIADNFFILCAHVERSITLRLRAAFFLIPLPLARAISELHFIITHQLARLFTRARALRPTRRAEKSPDIPNEQSRPLSIYPWPSYSTNHLGETRSISRSVYALHLQTLFSYRPASQSASCSIALIAQIYETTGAVAHRGEKSHHGGAAPWIGANKTRARAGSTYKREIARKV